MKRIIVNSQNLDTKVVDDTVIRVKALMVNKKEELLVVHNNDTYQFPGGHWKLTESLEETLEREIKEETGIKTSVNTGPFIVIEEYYDNYLNTGKSRCNKVYYYVVPTDDKPKIEEMSLSDLERKTAFNLFYIPIKDMEQFLKESMENKTIEKVIAHEMLEVMKEYTRVFIGD